MLFLDHMEYDYGSAELIKWCLNEKMLDNSIK